MPSGKECYPVSPSPFVPLFLIRGQELSNCMDVIETVLLHEATRVIKLEAWLALEEKGFKAILLHDLRQAVQI